MNASLDHVQIAIPAGGEVAVRQFYGALVGLDELDKPTEMEGRGGCWFALGEHQLHFGVDPDFRPARKAHVAIVVEDLTALLARLEDHLIATRDDLALPGVTRFFADDLHGNRIEFIQRRAR